MRARAAAETHSSPFKGEVRWGMGCTEHMLPNPIPTPALPLKGRENNRGLRDGLVRRASARSLTENARGMTARAEAKSHSSPFKGEARWGMGCKQRIPLHPIPTPALSLKGRESTRGGVGHVRVKRPPTLAMNGRQTAPSRLLRVVESLRP